MKDQKSSMRFRVPRLRPSVLPHSATQTPKRTQPIRQPPPPPPIQPRGKAPPPSPSTSSIQPQVTPPAPPILPPAPPVERSTTLPEPPLEQPEPPIEPSIAPPTLPQPLPPSPPHSSSESSKTESQPFSTSQGAIQSRSSPQPQPPSPSHISTQPHVSATPPPPSNPSPPTSPTHRHPFPPPSPPSASQPAKKDSSLPSSPTVTATKKEVPPVITLAGENRGTSMCIGYVAPKRGRAIHIHRRYKLNPDEITETTSDGEDSFKENDMENDAYINCNIQGINNSMVFNCSITERSPGVHLGSSCNPKNKNKRKRNNTNKVKVNISPSQNPAVRRRCLRGLFMESSSSEPDDPQKPRRHGCRHVCGEKSNKDDK
ncbi:hypothetical protein LXL04_031571 [Taraxacum kok-saghyz]